MSASHLEFHVEERSMQMFLFAWLHRFLPEDCTFEIYSYSGKHALLRRIGDRLKGYTKWMPAGFRIIVLVDRDADECGELKARLEQICENAGLQSRRASSGPDWQIATRIAVEELEAWYFGDWSAVCTAYPRVPVNIQDRARYRNPDAVTGGTCEAFEQILQKHGYFKQGLAKTQAAVAIGEHLDPALNRSNSFKVFRDAVAEAVAR